MITNPAKVRVISVITKAPDLECHVRVVDIEGVRTAEFRDYIPSLDEYGRGYWMPLTQASLYGLMNGLTEVLNSEPSIP